MPIEDDINAILDSGHGRMRSLCTSVVDSGSSRVTVDAVRRIDNLCWDAAASINRVANTIEFRAVTEGDQTANAVIVGNASSWAATGQARLPTYKFFYSDQFSGCIFFLFRDPGGALFAVHSYRSGGQYADPIPYFWRKGAKLLYCFSTAGVFTTIGTGVFGSVVVYATPTALHINFCAMREDQVVSVVDRTQINDWKTHSIDDPQLGGALPRYDPGFVNDQYQGVQAPAKKGLKHKVRKFFLKYIG